MKFDGKLKKKKQFIKIVFSISLEIAILSFDTSFELLYDFNYSQNGCFFYLIAFMEPKCIFNKKKYQELKKVQKCKKVLKI